jgi:choline dehydrogenase-like flavoprotein
MSDHYDIIVIGSGAGGGTLTYALAPTGKRILLLERGGFLTREVENWDPKSSWIDHRYRNSGKWSDPEGRPFLPKQHYYVGGNTKFYGAVLFRMRERDFGELAHVDGTSPAWPISYADLEPYYTRAEQLYQVHGERGIDPTDPPSTAPYPWPAVSDEPRIAELFQDLAAAGLHPFPLPVGVLLNENKRHLSACVRCATCDGYPCLVNGKADAHVMCVEPALRHPNVTLLTNALVSRLETDSAGRAVTRVIVNRDDQREVYSADIVVISAGAINSAALLLCSASDLHPEGLGNGSGVIGRHLMLHNNSSLIAFSKQPNLTKFQKTLGVNDFYFGDGEWPYPLGSIQMNGKSDPVLISFDLREGEDAFKLAQHSLDFWLTTEDLPDPNNRVAVDRNGQITLYYKANNVAAHRRLNDKFKSLLDAMRCERDVRDNQHYWGGQLGISGVAHQNGTVRFGDDPATAALDANCKLHELDNAYVVDASFFVSASSVNPTLTIIANALRVADHIADRLGVSTSPNASASDGTDTVAAAARVHP